MFQRLAILLLAGLAACAAPPTPPEGAAGSSVELQALSSLSTSPVGDFQARGGPMPDTSVHSGAIQRLVSGSSYATVYLFRRTPATVPDGMASAAAQQELADSAAVMAMRVAAETGARNMPRPIGVSGNRGGMEDLRCAAIAVPVPQGMQGDVVCVGGTLGRLLKLRLTFAIPGKELQQPAATILAGTMALALAYEVRSRIGGAPSGLRT